MNYTVNAIVKESSEPWVDAQGKKTWAYVLDVTSADGKTIKGVNLYRKNAIKPEQNKEIIGTVEEKIKKANGEKYLVLREEGSKPKYQQNTEKRDKSVLFAAIFPWIVKSSQDKKMTWEQVVEHAITQVNAIYAKF